MYDPVVLQKSVWTSSISDIAVWLGSRALPISRYFDELGGAATSILQNSFAKKFEFYRSGVDGNRNFDNMKPLCIEEQKVPPLT